MPAVTVPDSPSGEPTAIAIDDHAEARELKYKRGFFIEWRMADRHKYERFERIDPFTITSPTTLTVSAFHTVSTVTWPETSMTSRRADPGGAAGRAGSGRAATAPVGKVWQP